MFINTVKYGHPKLLVKDDPIETKLYLGNLSILRDSICRYNYIYEQLTLLSLETSHLYALFHFSERVSSIKIETAQSTNTLTTTAIELRMRIELTK